MQSLTEANLARRALSTGTPTLQPITPSVEQCYAVVTPQTELVPGKLNGEIRFQSMGHSHPQGF